MLVHGRSGYQIVLIYIMQDLVGLPELFSPGMLVRCVVSSVGITERGKKSVKLSLNPRNVNEVLSAEALKPGMVRMGSRKRSRQCAFFLPCLLGSIQTTSYFQLNYYTQGWVFSWGEGLQGAQVLNGNRRLEPNHNTLEGVKGKFTGGQLKKNTSKEVQQGEEFLKVLYIPRLVLYR